MEIKKLENDIVKRIEKLRDDIEAIQQPRSDFALHHFVVGQHDMPGRQRQQAVLELQIKMFNIRRAQLDEKKLIIEQERFRESDDPLDHIEAEKIDIDLAELRLARMGAIREATALLAILDQLPQYTYEQYQEEEAKYWQARLSRQALQDMRAAGTIGAGNLEAIAQTYRELGKPADALNEGELRALAMLKDD